MSYERLQRVLRTEAYGPGTAAVPIESESNEVWRVGEMVVRICWRGDRQRLLREALVGQGLPEEIGYPKILAVGRDEDISWMITRAIAGIPVMTVLDRLDSRSRHHVGVRLAELLRVVHRSPVPAGIDDRPGLDVVGEDVLPLPVPRARRLLAELSESRVDPLTADLVTERLEVLEPLDPFAEPGVLVHGDAGIENLLWDGERVVSFIDFEWVRSGAAWVDVIGYLRYGDADVARGVRDSYPELFDGDDAQARLQLLEVAAALRTLALWPGSRNVQRLREASESLSV